MERAERIDITSVGVGKHEDAFLVEHRVGELRGVGARVPSTISLPAVRPTPRVVWSWLYGERGTALRFGIALAGAAIFAGGVAAVFKTSNEGGAAALVTVGAVLLLLALLGDRVEALELGSAKLTLRDLARHRFALAREKEVVGDTMTAVELRSQGLALQRLANEYSYIRRSQKGGDRRTDALEHVMSELSRLATEHQFAPADVWEWFDRGQSDTRISAIGLMHGDPRLRDVFIALEAIERPRSNFERYHGLRLAYEMLPDLSPLERDWIRDAVAKQRFPPGTDRWREARAVLDWGSSGLGTTNGA